MTISLAISSRGIQTTRDAVLRTYNTTLLLTVDQFSDRLSDLRMLVASLSIDDALNAMCIVEKGREDLYDYVEFLEKIRSYANQRIMQGNIHVILPKQGWVISSNDRILRLSSLNGVDDYFLHISSYGEWGIRRKLADPGETCFSIVCGYLRAGQSNAIFVIEIDQAEVLNAIARPTDARDVAGSFLLDAGGSMYAQRPDLFDADAIRSLSSAMFGEGTSYEAVLSSGDRDYRVLGVPLDGTRCAFGILIDEQTILKPVLDVRAGLYVAIVAFFLAAFAYIAISYRRITAPVDQLQEAMHKVQAGDLSARAQSDYKNEIGDLARTFNGMVDRLDALIRDQYLGEIQLKQAQVKFLRAQINPHFLYNSLFTLYTLIKNEELDVAADLAVYLGQYYQINTRAEGGDAMLYREIECVRLLVNIQRIRFRDRLSYEEDVATELKTLRIPQLALLTIVENFLTHGLKDMKEPALLLVRARTTDEGIEIEVRDTGSGVTAERLDEIRRGLDDVSLGQSDVRGLQNVLIRFRMLYGEGVVMRVTRNEPRGMTVTMVLCGKERAGDVQPSYGR